MKHSAPSHSAPKAHHEPVKHEPAKAKHEPPSAVAKSDEPQAAKAKEVSVDGYTEQSRPERDRIAETIDQLIKTIKAELDTDRLQGTPRNALVETLEKLQAQRNQLSTVPGA